MDRIERAVTKALQPALKQSGFDFKKDWGRFIRLTSYGTDSLLVVNQGKMKSDGNFFEIACYAGIGHDRIEKPWNTLGLIYGEDAQLQTQTLSYIGRAAPALSLLKIGLTSMDSDVQCVADEIGKFFYKSALPFYERFCDLCVVEEWVNNDALSSRNPAAGGPMEHLAMRALLLAKAVNPKRYALVRDAFITLDKGMFPRDKRMALLKAVDNMHVI